MEQVCPRRPVSKLKGVIPAHFLEAMEQNQKIATCCRHPENHEVEGRKSNPDEAQPDIYTFHCQCGKKHHRFMAGSGVRPVWTVR